MTKYLLWKRQIKSHQHDRPVDGVETKNILSNQMKVSRPILFKHRIAVSVKIKAKSSDIVAKCINPYVNNMLWIEVYRNAPLKGGTGNAQILKSRKKEVVHHLILSGFWLDEIWMLINIRNKLICILAHTEEISFFLSWCTWASAVRAFAVN